MMAASNAQNAANMIEGPRLSVDQVKAQIIANCTTLWPILQAVEDDITYRDGKQERTTYQLSAPVPRPALKLITLKRGADITAHVVYEKDPPYHEIMMRGPDATSHCQAYERLLAMTEEILAKECETFMREEASEVETIKGYGIGYYVCKHEYY